MKGDFSRNTFDPEKHFLRVLMQQGRVQLDADFNEQVAILLRYMQALAVDLKGWHWGNGFQITERKEGTTVVPKDFIIQAGHYYVDGLLCECGGPEPYTKQPDYTPTKTELLQDAAYLVYLDVWERHITLIEDKRRDAGNIPGIREVALGGPDTATRSRIVWQVRVVPTTRGNDDATNIKALSSAAFRDHLEKLKVVLGPGTGKLRARANPGNVPYVDNPCVLPPQSRYRGLENQLYRVEIHQAESEPVDAGQAERPPTKRRPAATQKKASTTPRSATFKWSRENGSVVFPIREIAGAKVTLDALWRDDRFGLTVGDWVEAENDTTVMQGVAGRLHRVIEIDLARQQVTLDQPLEITDSAGRHPLLRRWDQRQNVQKRDSGPQWSDGAIVVAESAADEQDWIALENGIQIQFQPGGDYRVGDYWLIPARTAIGDVEWPLLDSGKSKAIGPHGAEHHYAPLTFMSVASNYVVIKPESDDCRRTS